MALHSDFEGIHRTILHCTPLHVLESVVHDLNVDETHIKYLVAKWSKASIMPIIFNIPS